MVVCIAAIYVYNEMKRGIFMGDAKASNSGSELALWNLNDRGSLALFGTRPVAANLFG